MIILINISEIKVGDLLLDNRKEWKGDIGKVTNMNNHVIEIMWIYIGIDSNYKGKFKVSVKYNKNKTNFGGLSFISKEAALLEIL